MHYLAVFIVISGFASAADVTYNADIRPILANNCFKCHGPDPAARKAELRLDEFEPATAELPSGKRAIVPGDWDASELARKLTAADPSDRMPPPETGKTLSSVEIETLREWINSGAEYQVHWAYVAPVRPELPTVQDASWPREELDRFVLARLESEGLAPSSETDPYTLIRRVSLDLIGLPPTPEETDAFVADPSPFAYAKLVNRLLASPHFGEHWARMWLDLARYADTRGYEKDDRRTIWRFRDWVVDAFNRDLPFDEFTIQQIAGDLLVDPTEDQLIATAFHRNTMNNDEGGTNDEEFRVAAVVDRVNTTMEVWMGATMACAQCHTHKYDPFTQTEYYQLFDFFNQTADDDNPSERPTLRTPNATQLAEESRLSSELDMAQRRFDDAAALHLDDQWAWERDQANAETLEPHFGDAAPALAALRFPAFERNDEENAAVRAAYYFTVPELLSLNHEVSELRRAHERVQRGIPNTPILQAVEAPRETRLLTRGSFLSPAEAVQAGVPSVLHALDDAPNSDAPISPDRLDLAHWLVDRANPLTARVMANRAWERLFGIGIVETSEDFGTQGTLPRHPELLDWLAIEFMEGGWSFKDLCRTIVMSATYRQRGYASEALLERDPYNRLLARGPRLRLDAEVVRDQALAASGLLSDAMYGPPVMPYQPDGVWQVVYSSDKWETSPGEDRHRRGIYTFWRRTSPYPSMIAFDAPSREVCTVRRTRTNTPLQALVTLNDPVYVEAAQSLARRMASLPEASIAERVTFGFRCALVRPPSEAENRRLTALFVSELEHYRARLAEAKTFAASLDGDDAASLAAWTAVANVLLNLDEAVTNR